MDRYFSRTVTSCRASFSVSVPLMMTDALCLLWRKAYYRLRGSDLTLVEEVAVFLHVELDISARFHLLDEMMGIFF